MDADKFNLSNEEACGYEPVLKNLTDKLIRQIDLVIGDLALERRSLASEILELKGDIMMKEEELHSLEETQNQKIAKLRSEKSRFAFLSLYKKKKWRAIIEAAVEEKERRVSAMILELDRMKKECEDKENDLENIQNDEEFSSVQDWQTGSIYR